MLRAHGAERTKGQREVRIDLQDVPQFPIDVFEHEVARTEVVQLTDVAVVQCRNRPRFLFESTQAIGVSAEWLRKDFDRDVTRETRIAGAVDLAHATSTER